MKDSYLEEYLPFKSDPELLDQYIFSDGKIRTGKLLEGIINDDHLMISYPF
jgi:acyl-coenzyme A thioesterase 9